MRFVLFGLTLLLGGCFRPAADYYPLAIGQETIMEFTLERDRTAIHDIFHSRVEGTVEKQGKTYYRSRTWLEANRSKHDPVRFIRKDARGVYSIFAAFTGPAENTELVLPLKVGGVWQRTLAGKATETTVIGRETVMAGGTTYADCFHIIVRRKDGSHKDDLWMAPNIGTIKSQSVSLDEDLWLGLPPGTAKSESVSHEGVTMTYTIKEFKSGW